MQMTKYRYAQVRANGTVEGESNLSGIVEAENLIPIPPGFNPWGKRWNGTGWEDCEPEPVPVQPDKTQADMDYLKMMAM